jgi:glycosyltransferase involved in cell wall biosynthesis
MRIEMGAKTSDPKVSVVMPNFNKGEFLAGAIESVLSQSMTSFELLIVDDASTDASSEIAGRYAERDSRITLIRNATRKGVSAARNTGIRLSRGPVIGFIDSDDLYAPTKLDRQLRVLEQSESPVVSYCDYWQVDEKGNELPPSRYPVYKESGSIFGDVLAGKFGIKTTILLPRECLQEVGPFDESLIFSEDLDMILRLSLRYPFIWLDEKLYCYRVFPGNTRNKISEFTFNSTRALVVEKYWKSSGAVLTSDQRRIVILNLTKHFRKSSQTGKMVSYGLKSAASFKYMVSEPFRRHGLRRLLRPLGSANSS